MSSRNSVPHSGSGPHGEPEFRSETQATCDRPWPAARPLSPYATRDPGELQRSLVTLTGQLVELAANRFRRWARGDVLWAGGQIRLSIRDWDPDLVLLPQAFVASVQPDDDWQQLECRFVQELLLDDTVIYRVEPSWMTANTPTLSALTAAC